jgi:tRNA nucleotidyltransferase (CCA-adding enzyme)
MQASHELTQRILKKITPSKLAREKVAQITRLLEQKVTDACKEMDVSAVVRVEGSVAKDTWLNENPDIDVFIRLPTSIPRKYLGDIGLKIAKKAAEGYEQIERYAEHPYLEIVIDGYHADIVPCYDAKPGEWQSATDRTPYHTDYIKTHLNKTLLGEVRLVKRFMQGIGVYGAEIKVGGFSGYLCELLVIKYGSFNQTVEAFAHYNRRIIVDIENVYAERQNELTLLFPEPLVIIDPVDKGRNVASAVQPQKLYEFIAASQAYIKKPAETFFYPPKTKPLPIAKLKSQLANRGSATVFIVISQMPAVPDVLWGQLYRTKRSLSKLLELADFRVLKDTVWSNEQNLSVFIFELENQILSTVKKHLGPPLEREIECKSFLSKYSENPLVISGPYVENGRWIVLVPRKATDAVELLKERLADGGKNAGVAELIVKSIQKDLSVLVGTDIAKVYVKNEEFAVLLTEFLMGKPFWLNLR